MSEPTHGTVHAEQRIRTLLAELPASTRNLGVEIVYSKKFRSEEWPRGQYALDRDDVDAVLAKLDRLRSLRLARPSEAVDPDVHTPERIGAYLTARGWTVTTPGVLASFWGHPEHPGRSERLLVPASNRGSDYARRVGELVSDLAGLYGVGELQALADIEAANDA